MGEGFEDEGGLKGGSAIKYYVFLRKFNVRFIKLNR